MTATLRRLAPTEVELDILVPESDVEEARERAFRRLSRRIRIPGFRPGHVPRRILEQHVGRERVDHEAIEQLVPEAYAKALEEHDLRPIARPKIDVERADAGQGFHFKATVPVRPEIALGDYKGIPIPKPAVAVADEEVEEGLQSLRRRAATLVPVEDRGIQDGDVVTIDYAGTIDGQPFEGGTAQGHTTEIAPNKFIPGFAEQLAGARPGEQRQVRVTFPQDYPNRALAGQTADFDVTVKAIKLPVLPELDERFVKQVSDFATVDELRAELRRRLEAAAQRQARDMAERQLVEELLARHDFPLPEVLVESEVERRLADAPAGANVEELRQGYREEARRRLKATLLLDEIAKAEGLQVTAADVDADIGRMARAMGERPRRVAAMLEGGGDRLVEAIRREKTMDFLLANAKAG